MYKLVHYTLEMHIVIVLFKKRYAKSKRYVYGLHIEMPKWGKLYVRPCI